MNVGVLKVKIESINRETKGEKCTQVCTYAIARPYTRTHTLGPEINSDEKHRSCPHAAATCLFLLIS